MRGLRKTARDPRVAHSSTPLLLTDYLEKMPNIKATIPWALEGKTSSQFAWKVKYSLIS